MKIELIQSPWHSAWQIRVSTQQPLASMTLRILPFIVWEPMKERRTSRTISEVISKDNKLEKKGPL